MNTKEVEPISYALTVKKTRGKPTQEDYQSYLDWLVDKGYEVANVNYEFTKGLHIHFSIWTEDNLKIKDPRLYRDKYGWNIYCIPQYSYGWNVYIKKDSKTPEVAHLRHQMKLQELHEAAPYPFDNNSPKERYPVKQIPAESDRIPNAFVYPRFDIRKI